MKKLLIALAAVLATAASYAQGTLAFNTRVVGVVDAPVTRADTGQGPGATYSAQLFLVSGNTFTAVPGVTTFRDPGTGSPLLARYVTPIDVTVPNTPAGSSGQFVLRAWATSAGSYDAAVAQGLGAQSAPFTAATGGLTPGGALPPGNLTGLQGFVIPVPEPSTIALGVLGAAALLLRRRK